MWLAIITITLALLLSVGLLIMILFLPPEDPYGK